MTLEDWSEKRPYLSKYSPGSYVSPSQYIAELICEKMATQKNKELPKKFWEISTWKKTYCSQIRAANELLKVYSHKAIVSALKDPSLYRIYSLRAPQLEKLIKEKERELQLKEEKVKLENEKIQVPQTIQPPRPTFTNKKSMKELLD